MTNTLKDLFKVPSFKIYRNKIDQYIWDYYQNLSDEDLEKGQRSIVKAPPTVTTPSINVEPPIVPTPSNICDIPLTVTPPSTSVEPPIVVVATPSNICDIPLTVTTPSTSVEPTIATQSTSVIPPTPPTVEIQPEIFDYVIVFY